MTRWTELAWGIGLLCSGLAATSVAQEGAPPPAEGGEDAQGGESADNASATVGSGEEDSADEGSSADGEFASDEDFGGEGDEDLDALLGRPVASGATGSFGYHLTTYGIQPYLHAYVTFDYANFEASKRRNTFDLHYFNVFVGANIGDVIFPEVQLEHEHGGEDIALRFAQVDAKVYEWLVVRVGLWLVPFGQYNELLYPEFLSKTPRSPLLDGGTFHQIIPVSWNDVGVQVRGRFDFSEKLQLNYAAYVSNGLEQEDDPATPLVEDGGSIRSMRKNFRDRNDGHKSLGGRLGATAYGFSFGASIYWGAYTEDGNQDLFLYGVDARYENGPLSIGVEFVYAQQQRDERVGHDLTKKGLFLWVAYRFEKVLGDALALDIEPVVAYDWVRLGGTKQENRRSYMGGMNLYPFPQVLPNMQVRFFYAGYDNNGKEIRDNIFLAQVTLGF